MGFKGLKKTLNVNTQYNNFHDRPIKQEEQHFENPEQQNFYKESPKAIPKVIQYAYQYKENVGSSPEFSTIVETPPQKQTQSNKLPHHNPEKNSINMGSIYTPPQTLDRSFKSTNELLHEMKKLKEENELLKKNISPAVRKKVREEKKRKLVNLDYFEHHFPTTVKQFTRHKLWRYVKFVNDEDMLNGYSEKGTIGYKFFQHYTNRIHGQEMIDSKKDEIWNDAKDYIEEALAAKRNAVQTSIKTSFKGKFSLQIRLS
jgi:hypothetical protein